MTDLRIQWCADQMPEPLRWAPLAGSLNSLWQGRVQAQYKVEFTPKSMRDYGAHNRLALILLHQIAPPTALAFLARSPHALDALSLHSHRLSMLKFSLHRLYDSEEHHPPAMKGWIEVLGKRVERADKAETADEHEAETGLDTSQKRKAESGAAEPAADQSAASKSGKTRMVQVNLNIYRLIQCILC